MAEVIISIHTKIWNGIFDLFGIGPASQATDLEAQMLEDQAVWSEEQGLLASERILKEGAEFVGTQKQMAAMSGVRGTGSTKALIEITEEDIQADAEQALADYTFQADLLRTQQQILRLQEDSAQGAMVLDLLGAAVSLGMKIPLPSMSAPSAVTKTPGGAPGAPKRQPSISGARRQKIILPGSGDRPQYLYE